MKTIDLRSDTVTHPTPSMWEAMLKAQLGDDVYEEDPTVNALQEKAAAMMGKEAGLFVPSGTMGNLIAILTHCGRGDEAIMGTLAHTFLYEAGGISALGGVHPFTVPNQDDGTLKLEDIRSAIRGDDVHHPVTRLVVLENTQNRCGGVPISAEYTRQVAEIAHQKGVLLHLDGARIFNAAAALNTPVLDLAAPADSITFCLSKGLCAPVGSVLCGRSEFIHRARRIRKQLGGGMRQAGILAAAGLVALDENTERLSEDHRHARALAQGLAGISVLRLKNEVPPSNMVFVYIDEKVTLGDQEIQSRLKSKGVLVSIFGPRLLRLVTHYWIDDAAVENTLAAFREVLA
ncbi:MAG: low-specificity L-threonine aldolase [Anaerolineae bacterium]|nr:low-specificity L-threonine aldolase [Anaerolineae bacterium]